MGAVMPMKKLDIAALQRAVEGQLNRKENVMSEAKRSFSGSFIWYDQMSNDLPGSERFYAKVVGWTLAPNTMNAPALHRAARPATR